MNKQIVRLPSFKLDENTIDDILAFYEGDFVIPVRSFEEILGHLQNKYNILEVTDNTRLVDLVNVLSKHAQVHFHDAGNRYFKVPWNENTQYLYGRDWLRNAFHYKKKEYLSLTYNPALDEWYTSSPELHNEISVLRGIPADASSQERVNYSVELLSVNVCRAKNELQDLLNNIATCSSAKVVLPDGKTVSLYGDRLAALTAPIEKHILHDQQDSDLDVRSYEPGKWEARIVFCLDPSYETSITYCEGSIELTSYIRITDCCNFDFAFYDKLLTFLCQESEEKI